VEREVRDAETGDEPRLVDERAAAGVECSFSSTGNARLDQGHVFGRR